MFTDIAGYTAQMSNDEARAMELLKEKESILKKLALSSRVEVAVMVTEKGYCK